MISAQQWKHARYSTQERGAADKGQRHARPGAYFRSDLGMHRCVFSGVVKALWFSLIKGRPGRLESSRPFIHRQATTIADYEHIRSMRGIWRAVHRLVEENGGVDSGVKP